MRTTMIAKITEAYSKDPKHVGLKVGMLCIEGEVPISFVEGVLDTNPVTSRRWLTGECIPQHKADIRKLKRLVYALQKAIDTKLLPSTEKFNAAIVLPLWAESKDAVK